MTDRHTERAFEDAIEMFGLSEHLPGKTAGR